MSNSNYIYVILSLCCLSCLTNKGSTDHMRDDVKSLTQKAVFSTIKQAIANVGPENYDTLYIIKDCRYRFFGLVDFSSDPVLFVSPPDTSKDELYNMSFDLIIPDDLKEYVMYYDDGGDGSKLFDADESVMYYSPLVSLDGADRYIQQVLSYSPEENDEESYYIWELTRYFTIANGTIQRDSLALKSMWSRTK